MCSRSVTGAGSVCVSMARLADILFHSLIFSFYSICEFQFVLGLVIALFQLITTATIDDCFLYWCSLMLMMPHTE